MPVIDYYAVCLPCEVRGPTVWRCIDPDRLRWFLVEHIAHDVKVVAEYDAEAEWPEWVPEPE